jgi:uncharacterized protein (DUF849 family)
VNLGLTSTGAVAADAAAGPYANPLADVEYMFARSGELGAAPSISVFEPGFLRTTLAWQRGGRLPSGAMVKLYFGGELEFGLRPTATALEAYLELLEPSGLPWSVAVLGGDVVGCGMAELAIRRGGHVRVGLEDYAGPGEPSNLDLLHAAVAVIAGLGHAPASTTQAARSSASRLLRDPPSTSVADNDTAATPRPSRRRPTTRRHRLARDGRTNPEIGAQLFRVASFRAPGPPGGDTSYR